MVQLWHPYIMLVLSNFSCVWLLATLWTVTHQAPLSMGFSRQEHWSGLPYPPPGDLPDPWVEPGSLTTPPLISGFFTTSATCQIIAFYTLNNLHFCQLWNVCDPWMKALAGIFVYLVPVSKNNLQLLLWASFESGEIEVSQGSLACCNPWGRRVRHNWLVLLLLLIVFKNQDAPMGLPWWLSDKEFTCQYRSYGFDSWSRNIPHAAEQLSRCITTIEMCALESRGRNYWSRRTLGPMFPNKRSHCNEKP